MQKLKNNSREEKERGQLENKTHLDISYAHPLQKCFPCQPLENNLLGHKLKRSILEGTPPQLSPLDPWILRRWANLDSLPVAFSSNASIFQCLPIVYQLPGSCSELPLKFVFLLSYNIASTVNTISGYKDTYYEDFNSIKEKPFPTFIAMYISPSPFKFVFHDAFYQH